MIVREKGMATVHARSEGHFCSKHESIVPSPVHFGRAQRIVVRLSVVAKTGKGATARIVSFSAGVQKRVSPRFPCKKPHSRNQCMLEKKIVHGDWPGVSLCVHDHATSSVPRISGAWILRYSVSISSALAR